MQAHHCRAFLQLVNKKKNHTTLSLPSKSLSSVCLLIVCSLASLGRTLFPPKAGLFGQVIQPFAQNGVLLHHLLHFSLREKKIQYSPSFFGGDLPENRRRTIGGLLLCRKPPSKERIKVKCRQFDSGF